MEEPSLEDRADRILREDAQSRGTTLYREGMLDARRQSMIRKREIPMSVLEKRRKRNE
jgi:hypothetical protein